MGVDVRKAVYLNKLKTYLLFLLCISHDSFSNAGGMFHYPGVISDPIANEKTDFAIEKEILDIEFYKVGTQLMCKYTAKYYLSRDSSTQEFVAGTFYGVRNQNIKIYTHSKRIDTTFNEYDQMYYDQNFLNDRSYEPFDQSWKNNEISIKNFIYYYDSLNENILTITGDGLLEYSQTWGLGAVVPSIKTRHPFINRKSGNFVAYFKYIIDPIHTWKSVGKIDVTIRFPEDYNVSIYGGKKLYTNKTDIYKKSIEKKGTLNSFTFSLEKEKTQIFKADDKVDTVEYFPSYLDIDIEKQQQTFHTGGLKIGFGSHRHGDALLMRYGWECACEKRYIDTHVSLDYDTDYKNYNAISLSIYVMSPWFGFPF